MSKEKYRGIVIGCGKIGVLYEAVEGRPHPRSHASALASNQRTELSAFVGRDERECSEAQKFFSDTPCFTDVETAFNVVKPDIAIIAASTATHAELGVLCARLGVPIIIGEKPLASNMQEAQAMARAIEEAGVTFALNYQRRYFPLFQRARERLQAGELGKIVSVECRYDNGLYNNGGHAIDTLLFLLADKFVEARCEVNAENKTHPEGDSNMDGTLTTKDGITITLRSFDQKIMPIHELHLTGERGSLSITDYGYTFTWSTNGKEHVEREEVSMTSGVLDDAMSAYEQKREPMSGIVNGIATLCVLEALNQSADKGGVPVALY